MVDVSRLLNENKCQWKHHVFLLFCGWCIHTANRCHIHFTASSYSLQHLIAMSELILLFLCTKLNSFQTLICLCKTRKLYWSRVAVYTANTSLEGWLVKYSKQCRNINPTWQHGDKVRQIHIITCISSVPSTLGLPHSVFTHLFFSARHWHHKAMGPVGARQPLCTHQARALCAIVFSDRLNEGECFSVPGCVGDTCWVGLHRPALLRH